MKEQTARAVLWMLLDIGGAQILSFVTYALLAHILGPGEFGVFAISLSLIAITNVVLFQGFGDALIQREDVGEDHLSTVFWINVAIALILTALLQLTAPLMADIFAAPDLASILRWMSLLCILRALVSVHSALCRRQLDLSVFALRSIAAWLLGGVASIVLALKGLGGAALVACQLVQAVVILIVMWRAVPWRPQLRFSMPLFHDMARFSWHYIAANLVVATVERIDTLVIGLFLDATAVGYYAMALRVIQTASMATISPVQIVVMPVLSRMVENRAAFCAGYGKLVLSTYAVWLPAAVTVGVLAPVLVPLVFGVQWGSAVPIVQAMCLAGLSTALWAFTGQALSALGRPDVFTRLATIQLVVAVLVFAAASQFGIVAAGWAWAGLSIVAVPLHLTVFRRVSGFDPRPLLGDAFRIALCGGAMAAVMLVVGRAGGSPQWVMVVQVAAGAAVYLALMELVLMRGYVSGLLALVLTRIPPRHATRASAEGRLR